MKLSTTSLLTAVTLRVILSSAVNACGAANAQHLQLTERNLLTGRYDSADVVNALLEVDEWRPYPTIEDRGDWSEIPEPVRLAHIAEAESLLGTGWPELPATVFLEFVRTGNRSNYQRLRSIRREQLAKLVLGEVFEDRGRFFDDIVNGIWIISEETYWGVPAHLGLQSAGFGLPDVDEPTVDLFAAETASLMAWTLYLLGDRLDAVSPLVRPRIRSELKRRILDPNLKRDDFWWMAFEPTVVNNWTPWVNSNWLTVVLTAEDDPVRRGAAVYKIMRSVDVFINSYPDDGGCDEGPVYWTRAAGSLFEVLELLRSASDGLIDIYEDPLVKKMGRYILKGHIGGDYFINFADARPKIAPPASLVFRYGQRIADKDMTRFGAYFARRQALGTGYVAGEFGHLGRQLLTLFALEEMAMTEGEAPLSRDVWLPDLQVMAARSTHGSTDGLFVAAKGGHNAENHNHNDVGSFMVYVDGEPVIIDVGPGTYTRQTFSEDRYSIWNFQSAYHNVPTVNGHMQPAGAGYRARGVRYTSGPDSAMISMDIAGAYPVEAGADAWHRRILLRRAADRRSTVYIMEDYELSVRDGQTSLNLMTNWKAEIESNARIRLHHPVDPSRPPLWIHLDSNNLRPSLEIIPVEDAGLAGSWGEEVTRIILTLTDEAPLSGRLRLEISSPDPVQSQD